MKAQWYGDSRDLIKWGCLLHLAEQYEASKILQVAFLTETPWPKLTIDSGGNNEREVELPDTVKLHFRDINHITLLKTRVSSDSGRQFGIEVLSDAFSDRGKYLAGVLQTIKGLTGPTAIVFLDPDNGLAPKKSNEKHVRENEVRQIWSALRAGDVLALYQHKTNRRGNTKWAEDKRDQLETVLDEPHKVKIATSTKPGDIAILYCQKLG